MSPAREWYLSDLARHLNVRASSLQRELASLVAAGILRRREDRSRAYYQAETASPIFVELRGLLRKTIGLRDVLAESLKPLSDRIRVAFVYGLVARDDVHATSDIDLMVIGDVGLAELAPALKDEEDTLARPVNPSVYTGEELAERRTAGHHFLGTVLSGEKLFVVGDADDLEQALERESRSRPPDKQKRARRLADSDRA